MKITAPTMIYHSNTQQNKQKNISFGIEYPYEDVMSILSWAYAGNRASLKKTLSKMFNDVEISTPIDKMVYLKIAKYKVGKKYPELKIHANNFLEALNNINPDHSQIPPKQMSKVIESGIKSYGRRYIDIEI